MVGFGGGGAALRARCGCTSSSRRPRGLAASLGERGGMSAARARGRGRPGRRDRGATGPPRAGGCDCRGTRPSAVRAGPHDRGGALAPAGGSGRRAGARRTGAPPGGRARARARARRRRRGGTGGGAPKASKKVCVFLPSAEKRWNDFGHGRRRGGRPAAEGRRAGFAAPGAPGVPGETRGPCGPAPSPIAAPACPPGGETPVPRRGRPVGKEAGGEMVELGRRE